MGLVGSHTGDNANLMLEGAGADKFAQASWTQDDGKLVLYLGEYMEITQNDEVVLTFSLMNPVNAQAGSRVTVYSESLLMAEVMETVGTEDNEPLYVKLPEITKAEIAQSTTAPGATNTITVTLRSNAPIKATPRGGITISGFNGAICKEGPISIFDEEGCDECASKVFKSHRHGVPGTGMWNVNVFSIALAVVNQMKGETDYVFSFHCQNPTCEQDCDAVMIETTGLTFDPIGCDVRYGYVPSSVPFQFAATLAMDEACPITVEQPNFIKKSFTHCSDVCGTASTISVTLMSNVDLEPGTTLSISLRDAHFDGVDDQIETMNGPAMRLTGPDAVLFNGMAMWNPEDMVLDLVLASKGVMADTEISFSFS
eukprot:707169-Rhodomonas_salina.1